MPDANMLWIMGGLLAILLRVWTNGQAIKELRERVEHLSSRID